MQEIQSWVHKYVRIKDEYIKKVIEVDIDESTFDDDDNIIEEVLVEREYIDTPNGLRSVFEGREREHFLVRSDCYGIDLYTIRHATNIDELPKPTHQIIIGKPSDYPFMWDSKYFELI